MRLRPYVIPENGFNFQHIPLMKTNPEEAVKNNIVGTYNTATLADLYKVKKFVLISTNKAVNPTNVMSATKRSCEMIVQNMAQNSKLTQFVTVRFGNVLGSNGSVIPLFERQIKEGVIELLQQIAPTFKHKTANSEVDKNDKKGKSSASPTAVG